MYNYDSEDSDSDFSIDSLHKAKRDKLKNDKKVYKVVLKKCFGKIKYTHANTKIEHCYYQVPEFVYGYPPVDVKRCTIYLMVELRKRGFSCEYTPKTINYNQEICFVYISWKKTTKGKIEPKRKKTPVKNKRKVKKYKKVKQIRPKKKEQKVIEYNPKSALSKLKLRAELIRQSK
mgnify:CR=1 FL=1